jgi:hypothetical protein
MFDIHCNDCHTDYIVGPRSLLALTGARGRLHGRAQCPLGHEVDVDFSAQCATCPPAASSHPVAA